MRIILRSTGRNRYQQVDPVKRPELVIPFYHLERQEGPKRQSVEIGCFWTLPGNNVHKVDAHFALILFFKPEQLHASIRNSYYFKFTIPRYDRYFCR